MLKEPDAIVAASLPSSLLTDNGGKGVVERPGKRHRHKEKQKDTEAGSSDGATQTQQLTQKKEKSGEGKGLRIRSDEATTVTGCQKHTSLISRL